MKLYKLLYSAFALSVLAGASSCSDDFLTMSQTGVYDELDSETKISWYLGSIYQLMYGGISAPNQTICYTPTVLDNLTEEQWGLSAKTDSSSVFWTIDELSGQGAFMSTYYGTTLAAGKKSPNSGYHQIRYCCEVIDQATRNRSKVGHKAADEAIGQAYYLRAAQFFDLVRIYGPMPIVTEVVNAEVLEQGLPRASVTQCVEQIVKDLDKASTLLPDNWGDANYGRASRISALALKSRVLLFYASPIFNRDWDNPQSDRWQAALAAAKEADAAAQAAGYGLDDVTDAKSWENMLCRSDNKPTNKEGLIVRLLATGNVSNGVNNSWEDAVRVSSQSGGGGKPVPVELIDMFPKADGTLVPESELLKAGNMRFMEDRDPRFYRTFAFNGEVWGYGEQSNDTVWAYRWFSALTPGEDGVQKLSMEYSEGNNIASPVFVRKMSDPKVTTANIQYSGTMVYDMRYAELVLNLAECCAATGDIAGCKSAIARLRSRVGIPSASSYGLDSYVKDKYSALSACLRERAIELAYEGKRCWDLWRWLLYDGGRGTAANGEALYLSDKSTCDALGFVPLNNRARTSYYVDVKPSLYTPSGDASAPTADPLVEARMAAGANPDAADFKAQLAKLADFWVDHFVLGDPEYPADRNATTNEASTIQWKANYYVSGINKTALDKNAWLGQTVGWGDSNGAPGTVSFQDNEPYVIQ